MHLRKAVDNNPQPLGGRSRRIRNRKSFSAPCHAWGQPRVHETLSQKWKKKRHQESISNFSVAELFYIVQIPYNNKWFFLSWRSPLGEVLSWINNMRREKGNMLTVQKTRWRRKYQPRIRLNFIHTCLKQELIPRTLLKAMAFTLRHSK